MAPDTIAGDGTVEVHPNENLKIAGIKLSKLAV